MTHVNADNTPAGSGTNPIERHDIAATKWLAQARNHPVVDAATSFTKLADQPPLVTAACAVVALGLLAGDRRLARRGGHILVSVVLATALKNGIKRLVARSRPQLLFEDGVQAVKLPGSPEKPWQSFPSGHTAGSIALARAVARGWPPAELPAYTGAAAVALAMVARGAHYPSDVLAGALIGTAAEAIADRLLPPG